MHSEQRLILTINAGSSSIKLAVFTIGTLQKTLEVTIENIGQPTARLVTNGSVEAIVASNHDEAAAILTERVQAHIAAGDIAAVGHRIVHGGPTYYRPTIATDDALSALQSFATFDPEHLPVECALVETTRGIWPHAMHVLCFDTAFHHELPIRSRLLPVPRRLADQGVRRYGFHGLSYAFVMEELKRVEGETAANGKVIIAHLGSGASLTALQNGKPIDTTMSMTPVSGIPMSTRSGDLDPGLIFYLSQAHDYTAEQIQHMLHFESGLLGISETTDDMKRLLEMENDDPRARDAVEIFCYNVTKTIGGFAAALGGLNTLVFTGGMGENAPKIRARVCAGLAFLGITLDDQRNIQSERLISSDTSLVGVHVIHTDEAVTIARETASIVHRNETRGEYASN